MLLRRFGQDPATSSSIILTTVTDVVGFFSFLGIATLFAPLLQQRVLGVRATPVCLATHACERVPPTVADSAT